MELVLINKESAEWEYMWNWLASHPINEGIENPSLALNAEYGWEYMGSYKQGERVLHTFRHKLHPRYNRVETVSVSESKDLTPDQIAKNFKL